MGMVSHPARQRSARCCRETLRNLEPAEEEMPVRTIWPVAKTIRTFLYFPEPTKEEEKVAGPYPLVTQVAFCCRRLTKSGLPAGWPGHAFPVQIWVQMCAVARAQLPSRQIGDDGSQGYTRVVDSSVRASTRQVVTGLRDR